MDQDQETSLRFAPSKTTLSFKPSRTALRLYDTDGETMIDEYHLTRGDTKPLVAQCVGPDGPVDLTDARATLTVTTLHGVTALETRADPVDGEDEPGWVRHEWRRHESEGFDPGHYRVSVSVRFSDGEIQTFPNGTEPAIMSVTDP